jgi:hypothetical protein
VSDRDFKGPAHDDLHRHQSFEKEKEKNDEKRAEEEEGEKPLNPSWEESVSFCQQRR